MRSWATGTRAHGPDRRPNLLHETGGARALAADREGDRRRCRQRGTERVRREHGEVHGSGWRRVQPVLLDVLHDADHFPPVVLRKRAGPNSLAECARGLGCKLASEILGNDGHAAARLDVVPSHVASGDQPRAHGGEIPRRHTDPSARR